MEKSLSGMRCSLYSILIGPLNSENHDAVYEYSVAFDNTMERQQQ